MKPTPKLIGLLAGVLAFGAALWFGLSSSDALSILRVVVEVGSDPALYQP